MREIAEMPSTPDNVSDILDKLAYMGIDYREASARIINSILQKEIERLPEFDMPKPLKKGKKSGAKTVKIDISIGRSKRIAPNFILGALVDATGMSGKDFGKIDIFDNHTTVEIPETETDYILDNTNPMKINGNKVEVRLYKGNAVKEKTDKIRRTEKTNKPDRRKSAYGIRKKANIFGDYTPNRKKRTKKRH